MENRVIICGLGHVGYRTAILLRRLGFEVTAIYENTAPDWIRHATALGIFCHPGDARDDGLLEKAGIRTARAIIAATDHDMTNISVAMDARRLNPDIVTVVRLFDTSLAPHIEAALNLRKALSTSSLAAPVFASAAIGHNVAGYFAVAGRSYTLSEFTVPSDSPWLGMTWAIVAEKEGFRPVFQVDDSGTVVAIASGLCVQVGQRIMLLRKAALDWDGSSPGAPPSRPATRRGRRWPSPRRLWRDIPTTIKAVMAALAFVIGAGTITFHLFLNMNPVDAFYFVITTISTTGYGDYNLQGSPSWLKLFGCFMMLCGAALMATVFSVVTDLLLKARFRRLMGTPEEAEGPHTIVVGQNNVGQRIAEELLRAGLPVVILTPPSPEHSERQEFAACPVIVADPRYDAALARAGIATATAVVAVTEDDIMNLGVAFQARKLNPSARSVIRTFDATLGAKLQSQLGGEAVLSASAVSAPTFAASLFANDVVQATVWRDHLILVQFAESGTCPPLDRSAPAVSFHGAEALGLGRPIPPFAQDKAGPELRISALRLAQGGQSGPLLSSVPNCRALPFVKHEEDGGHDEAEAHQVVPP
jgi:Trk K+ transport system NAD-binding subunit